jgi:hypothetical protein
MISKCCASKFFEGVIAPSKILELGVNQVMQSLLEMLDVQRLQQHLCVSLDIDTSNCPLG